MALESFYGGKPGISPVIRNSFKYINDQDPAYQAKRGTTTPVSKLSKREKALLGITDTDSETERFIEWNDDNLTYFTMDKCFRNPNYRDVWYNELCIIDTENKMNPNNGKLFRRTLKRLDTVLNSGDTTYAEYIGQIVGPSGGVPNIRFGSIDDMRKQATGLQNTLSTDHISENNPADITNWDYSYPTKNNDDTVTITIANPADDNRSDDYEKIAVLDSKQSGSIQLVPGKKTNEENTVVYNDDIKYTWCNVRRTLTNGGQDDAWIYLGFEIPYTVFDVERSEIPYWDPRTNLLDHSQKDNDNKEHPFYHNLHFYIPRGTRGIGPEQLFVVTPNNPIPNNPILYDFNAITYNQETDTYNIDTNKKKIFSNPEKEKTYWVAKWRLYNPKTTYIQDVYQYLGSYRDIDNIELKDDGTLIISYSDGTKQEFSKKITWITDVNVDTELKKNNEYNSNYGNITIKFNNEKIPEKIENLHLIKDIIYSDSTGEITFDYSGNVSYTKGNIVYPKTLEIDTNYAIKNDGTFDNDNYGKVTYYNNTDYKSDGKLKDNVEKKTIATLPLIKSTSIDKGEGTITFVYSNDLEITTGLEIKDIQQAVIFTGTQSEPPRNENPVYGHLYVKYNRDNKWTDLGQVKTSPTTGIVLSFPLNTDINTWLDNANTADIATVKPPNSYITPEGNIFVNGEDSSSGIIAVVKENDDGESLTYLVYYDRAKGKWVNGGTLGDSTGGKNSGEFYVVTGIDENSEPIYDPPSISKKTQYHFILETIPDTNNSPLKMPWES